MGGARRQIFVVFAAFLMVEKFEFSVGEISLLLLANAAINVVLAPKIGRLIHKFGERKALTLEYLGLIFVFSILIILSSIFVCRGPLILLALAIAIKTYFQKIADPADIASSAGVSFSINHIAAVFIPAALGMVWIWSHSLVFYIGACFALASLIAAQYIPKAPSPGH